MVLKLSRRSEVLLAIINHESEWAEVVRPGQTVTRYFSPRAEGNYSHALDKLVKIHGVGDGIRLHCLARNGLIAPLPSASTLRAYTITEKGILWLLQKDLADFREERDYED